MVSRAGATEKREVKAELLAVRRIVRRMEAFARNRRDVRLQRGLADWKSYEEMMVQLAEANVRRSPYVKISGAGRGETEIAERLLCATFIIRRLWPKVSVYAKMQELLAEPTKLPHLATAAEDSAKGLKTINGERLYTALEIHRMARGEDTPSRRYSRSEKALQSCVARLQK